MPVTAKLSLKFYERFGEDIANELVDWLNQVDTAYRTELREINELNFARFEAKLEHRLAESDARWERRMGELRTELREVKADLIKWAFVFVAGGTITVLGVMLTVLSRS